MARSIPAAQHLWQDDRGPVGRSRSTLEELSGELAGRRSRLVTYSDGFFTDLSHRPRRCPAFPGDFVKLYAAKHNPFVYFKSVQEGNVPPTPWRTSSVSRQGGLYDDLSSGHLPAFSLIAPNQCNDQHGRGNAGAHCAFDPITDGSQAGLNPALISGRPRLRSL